MGRAGKPEWRLVYMIGTFTCEGVCEEAIGAGRKGIVPDRTVPEGVCYQLGQRPDVDLPIPRRRRSQIRR